MGTDPVRCCYCGGVITGLVDYRAGRAYHPPRGQFGTIRIGGCASSDKLTAPPRAPAVNPDQLSLGV